MARLAAQEIAALARLDEGARHRLADTADPAAAGAWAALECHYHAFNRRDLDLIRALWSPDPTVRLDRPTGTTTYGVTAIADDYGEIFDRPRTAVARLTDIDAFVAVDQAIFVGTEVIDYSSDDDDVVTIEFRATRCFAYDRATGRWYEIHYHGSRSG